MKAYVGAGLWQPLDLTVDEQGRLKLRFFPPKHDIQAELQRMADRQELREYRYKTGSWRRDA